MFATHQPIIGHFAKKSPENTWKLLAMVQASIRMKFYRLPELLKNPEHLTARQREYIAEYWTRRNEIYAALHSNESTREKMRYLVELPGLGIPKAGFVMQLAHGTVGCLDTHNLERYGLSAKAFRSNGCTAQRLTERLDTYLHTCQSIGCATLWDTWCEYVAALYPKHFTGAEHVSQLHVDLIVY